jgi:hypothetical protein
VDWYNHEHRHSTIHFVTPAGKGMPTLTKSFWNNVKAVYEAALARHSQRWSRAIRNWNRIHAIHLNPDQFETNNDHPNETPTQDKMAA